MNTADLKDQIERILHWEPSSHWHLRDFVQLSDHILAHTQQYIEPHDLQTFWQRNEKPLPSVLDALARFADYDDWTDFCARNVAGEMVPLKPRLFHRPHWEVPARWARWILWGSVLAAVTLGALLWWKR